MRTNIKQLAASTIGVALGMSVFISANRAFAYTVSTVDLDGITYATSIQDLNISGQPYNVTFLLGSFSVLYDGFNNPNPRPSPTFFGNPSGAQSALSAVITALNDPDSDRAVNPLPLLVNNIPQQDFLIPTERDTLGIAGYAGTHAFTPPGVWQPLGFVITRPDNENNFAEFTPVPEPLTLLGSVVAGGFGIAMKRKFARSSSVNS
jgi:hypothetical protein